MDNLQSVLSSCQSLMAFFVKFNSATVGRDKLCRLTQYASKFAGHILLQRNFDKDVLTKLKKLEVTMSTSRKTFRLGKFIDMIQGAIKGLSVGDPVLRTCIIITRLCRTIYFVYDLLNWATRVPLIKGSSKEYAMKAAPFWLIAIFVSLIRDLYEIVVYINKTHAKRPDACSSVAICHQRPDIVVDAVKNASDLALPLNIMGKIALSQGTVGLLGLISSTCGILAVVSPLYKLTPM